MIVGTVLGFSGCASRSIRSSLTFQAATIGPPGDREARPARGAVELVVVGHDADRVHAGGREECPGTSACRPLWMWHWPSIAASCVFFQSDFEGGVGGRFNGPTGVHRRNGFNGTHSAPMWGTPRLA